MNRQLAGEQVRKLVLATNFGYSDQSACELMRVIATPFIKDIISAERERGAKEKTEVGLLNLFGRRSHGRNYMAGSV